MNEGCPHIRWNKDRHCPLCSRDDRIKKLEAENVRLKDKVNEWKKRADYYEKRIRELQRNVDPRVK